MPHKISHSLYPPTRRGPRQKACGLRRDSVRIPTSRATCNKPNTFVLGLAVAEGFVPLFLIRYAHKNAGRGSSTSPRFARLVYRLRRSNPCVSGKNTIARRVRVGLIVFAETQGFEPWRAFRPCLVSSEVLSTTQPRLRIFFIVRDVASLLPPTCLRNGWSDIRPNG